jgi:hypothetical protein
MPSTTRLAAICCLVLASILGGVVPASTHPLASRQQNAAGSSVAVGAVNVTLNGAYVALFEFYVHVDGAVVTQRGTDGTDEAPTTTLGPWVAAMYYPFNGENNVTTFTSRPADKIQINPQGDALIRFSMPGVGSVRLVLTGSSASPSTRQVAFTTPGNHHGHTWTMLGGLVQGKPASAGGTITKGALRYKIVPLRIDGALIAYVGQAAAVRIQST